MRADLPGGDAEGAGAGRGQALPAPPGARALSRADPELMLPPGRAGPSRRERQRESKVGVPGATWGTGSKSLHLSPISKKGVSGHTTPSLSTHYIPGPVRGTERKQRCTTQEDAPRLPAAG